MKTSEALQKAWALIESPEKWTQNALARDAQGKERYVSMTGNVEALASDGLCSPVPTCFCAKGAVRYACKDMMTAMETEKALNEAVWGVTGQESHETLMVFNDNHTHEELKEVWHIAIAKAKEQEA